METMLDALTVLSGFLDTLFDAGCENLKEAEKAEDLLYKFAFKLESMGISSLKDVDKYKGESI